MERSKVCYLLFILWLVSLFTASTNIVHAQEKFPAHHLDFWIPYAAGGGTDLVCRHLIQETEKVLGVPIVPKNIHGGAGSFGASKVKDAKPDGYTLGGLGMWPLAAYPYINPVDYDPLKDFTFIISSLCHEAVLLVKKDAPWKTFEEFMQDARRNPRKIILGDSTPGGFLTVGVKWLEKEKGVEFKWIPAPTARQSIIDLLGGHVDFTVQNPPAVLPYIKSGDLRQLVSLGDKRCGDLNAPTLRELGYNYEQVAYMAVGGPKGMPKDRVKLLHDAFKRAADSPDYHEFAEKMQERVIYLSGEDFAKAVARYQKEWGDLIKESGYGKAAK